MWHTSHTELTNCQAGLWSSVQGNRTVVYPELFVSKYDNNGGSVLQFTRSGSMTLQYIKRLLSHVGLLSYLLSVLRIPRRWTVRHSSSGEDQWFITKLSSSAVFRLKSALCYRIQVTLLVWACCLWDSEIHVCKSSWSNRLLIRKTQHSTAAVF